MESKEVLELITALVDNEIETKEKTREIKSLIEKSEELNFEYQIQNFIKTTIHTRIPKIETPQHLRNQVIRKLLSEINSETEQQKPKPAWSKWIFKPAFAFSIFIIVFLAIFLFTKNNLHENIIREQNGEANMFIQALHNFQNLVDGNASAQLHPTNTEELKNYFKKNGMTYEANIPLAKNWYLAGASVSEFKGIKLAHNMYRNSSGKLAYLYQANEDFLVHQKILNLSDDLIKLINEGKSFRYNDKGKSVIIWKCKKNICILVSNDNLDKLDQFAATR